MSEQAQLPFHSFSFTLVEDRRPRSAFRMRAADGGMYELHVEKGSASNPTTQFTRQVPLEVAQRLKDALQDIGVFSWDESYGNDPEVRGGRRWTVSTVFREGVFTVASRGGTRTPVGFELMLEELYRLDFPRPKGADGDGESRARTAGAGSAINALGLGGMGSIGGMSAGDLGAYSAAGGLGGSQGVDFSQIADALGRNGLPGVPGMDSSDMAQLMADVQRNPQALQQRMREEFRHMSRDEQERMLDALASTGMATRAWWERFLRGE